MSVGNPPYVRRVRVPQPGVWAALTISYGGQLVRRAAVKEKVIWRNRRAAPTVKIGLKMPK